MAETEKILIPIDVLDKATNKVRQIEKTLGELVDEMKKTSKTKVIDSKVADKEIKSIIKSNKLLQNALNKNPYYVKKLTDAYVKARTEGKGTFDSLKTGVNAVNTTLTKSIDKLNKMGGEVTENKSKIDRLKQSQSDLNRVVGDMGGKFRPSSTALDGLRNKILGVKSDITTVSNKMATWGTNISNAGSKLSAFGSKMNSMGNQMMGLGLTGLYAGKRGLDTYIDGNLAFAQRVAINNDKMGTASYEEYANEIYNTALKYGANSSNLMSSQEQTMNALTPYDTARYLDVQAKMLRTAPGLDSSSLAQATIVANNAFRVGTEQGTSIEDFGDLFTALIKYSSDTPTNLAAALAKGGPLMSQYGSNYDQAFREYTTAMAVMTSGGATAAEVQTQLTQNAMDDFKKNINSVGEAIYTATNRKWTELDTDDLQRIGLLDAMEMKSSLYRDILSVEGATLNIKQKDGTYEKVSAKDLENDLLGDLSGNKRAIGGLLNFTEKMENGIYQKILDAMNNSSGLLDSSVTALDRTGPGRLSESKENIKTNFNKLLERLVPVFDRFLDRIVKATDFLDKMDPETIEKFGNAVADGITILLGMGVITKVIGSVCNFFGLFMSGLGGVLSFTSKGFGKVVEWYTKVATVSGTNFAKKFGWVSSSVGQTGWGLALKFGALITATGLVISMFNKLVDNMKEMAQSKPMAQAREDWVNGKDTAGADLYGQLKDTALGRLMFGLGEGEVGNALLGVGEALTNPIGTGLEMAGIFIKDKINADAGNKILDFVNKHGDKLAYLSGPQGGFNSLLDKIGDNADIAKKEELTANGEYRDPYAHDEETQSLLDQLAKDEPVDIPLPDLEPISTNDIYDAMKEGAADGTEKGIKAGLSGHYNTPSDFSILSRSGVREMSNYKEYGMSYSNGKMNVINGGLHFSISGDGATQEGINKIGEKVYEILADTLGVSMGGSAFGSV